MFRPYGFKGNLLQKLKSLMAIILISLFILAPVKYVKAADKTADDSTESVADNTSKPTSIVSQAAKVPAAASTSVTDPQNNHADKSDPLNLEDGNPSSSDATMQNKRQHSGNTVQTQTAESPEKNLSFQSPANALLPQSDQTSGALAYEYPITIPPGRNGLQPDLRLSYTSQGQNDSSTYGYAWSLSIPWIKRVNKKGIDKLYSASASDWYFESSLDSELVLVSTGGTKLTYQARTEEGSFNLYVLDTSANAWTVTMKSGMVFLFGTAANSRLDDPTNATRVFEWFVDKQSDANGNFISYSYTKDQGQVYLNSITYTNNSTSVGIYQVNFNYEIRPDIAVAYTQGFLVTTAKRLNQVEVTNSGNWVRHYDLVYSISPGSGRSLLQSITESGRNDAGTTTQLPPTTFSYNQATAGLSEQGWTLPTISSICCQNGQPYTKTIYFGQNGSPSYAKVIDVNSDNLPDIIYSDGTITAVTPYQTAAQVWINNGSGWTLNPSWSFPVTSPNGAQASTFAIDDHYTRFVDVSSDGLVDVVTGGWGDLSATNPKIAVYINTGSGWSEDPSWQLPVIYSNAGINYTVSFNQVIDSSGNWGNPLRFVDINNDGKVDIVYATGCSGDTCGPKKSTVILNTGSGWRIDSNWQLPAVQGAPGAPYNVSNLAQFNPPVFIVDVNGDGLPDILDSLASVAGGCGYAQGGYFKNTGNGWIFDACWDHQNFPGYWSQLADINNDGLVDVITAEGLYAPGSAAFLNTGSGWASTNSWHFPLLGTMACSVNLTFSFATGTTNCNQTIDGTSRIIDVNGDNLPDIFKGSSPGQILSTVGVYGNNAQNLQLYSNWAVGSPYFSSSTGDLSQPYDLNSDGLPDFIYTSSPAGCLYNPINCQEYSRVYINVGAKSDILASVVIPSGATTSITYKQTVIRSNASPTEGQSQSIYVVKTITANDGTGNTSIMSYAYEGGSFYFGGPTDRRFAGFSKIAATDSAGNVTNTYFHQGNSSDLTHGEYNDEYCKIGKPYRVEVTNSSGNLYLRVINKWDSYDLGGGRKFVKLAQALSSAYDGNVTHRDKAESCTYDNTNGNITQKIEYGEVVGSDNGTFSDMGSDTFTTTYAYAANVSAYILGLPAQITTTDQSSVKVKESLFYYDLQALGSVTKGNLTKQADWKTGTSYITRQKTYYDPYGLVTVDTDPRGIATTYVYDTNNLYPATVSNALNQTVQFTYDYSSGQVAQKTDPNSRVFQYVYDGLGRLLEEKQPDITTPLVLVTKATYTYTDTPNAMSVKESRYLDASTIIDSYAYFDGLGRKIQTRKEAEGNNFSVRDFSYDNEGNLAKQSLPYFSQGSAKTSPTTDTTLYSTLAYDPLGRTTTTTTLVGTTTNTYANWKMTITDAGGKTKDLVKDAQGNLVEVDEHNGSSIYTTRYTYNYLGNLLSLSDALGNVRSFTYDGLGRRLTAQDLHASGDTTFGTWTYLYDDAGNLIQSINPNSQTVNYTYDSINRRLTENYVDQAGIEVTYSYDSGIDGKGHLTGIVSTAIYQTNTYNALGLIKQESKSFGSMPYLTSYDYNRQGDQTLITNPDGSQVQYLYNSVGLLDSVQRKESTDSSFANVATFHYSPTEQVTTTTYANGQVTTNTYDATKLYRLASKVTTIAAGSHAQDLAYTYDPVGNITQILDNSATSTKKAVNYGYDDLYRLTSATATGVATGQQPYSQTYTYDAIGNLTSKSDQGNYTYAGNQGTSYANPHAVTFISSGGSSTELLTSAWHLSGNNGSAEAYQSVDPNILNGKSSITVTYDLHGLCALGGDASALVIDQPGSWGTYVSLSNYGQNCHNGPQTVTIPLSDFPGLNTSQPLVVNGSFHIRFWSGSAFNVDITSLKINSGGSSAAANMTYDHNGNLLSDGTLTNTWDYNNRLTQSTIGTSTVRYAYDPFGQRTALASGSGSSTALLTSAWHLSGNNGSAEAYQSVDLNILNGKSSVTVTYDLHGLCALGGDASALVIDQPGSWGTYVSLSNYGQNCHNGPQTVTIPLSDFPGLNTSQPLGVNGSFHVRFWSGSPFNVDITSLKINANPRITDYPSKFYNTDWITPVKHIFAGSVEVATVTGSGSNAVVRYISTDHLASSNIVSNSSGIVVQLLDYYPYGGVRINEGTDVSKRKFIGEFYDQDTALTYLNARYYSGTNAKFISQDPSFLAVGDIKMIQQLTLLELQEYLSDPQSMNSYSYARNNPVVKSDPTGNYWFFSKTRAANNIRNNRDSIVNAANQYRDVRPEMVAGVIYQERRDNVNPFDVADRPLGNLGVNTSVGLGQVRINTLKMLMDKSYIAGIDSYSFTLFGHNVTNSLSENEKYTTLLSNPAYNAIFVAAYLQYLIDTWKGQYPNIANDPAILGTLYNLGSEQTTPNSSPKPNDFGKKVGENSDYVKSLLKK